MIWRPTYAVAAILFLAPAVGLAAEDFQRPVSLDGLYLSISDDLSEGKPLIVAAYYGMWYTRQDNPERNLNWGMRDSHYTMLKKARRDKNIRKMYRHRDWREVYFDKREGDPMRTAVFKQVVKPNGRWRELGVEEPIIIYLVMFAYQERQHAGLAMGRNLFSSEAPLIQLDDGSFLDVAATQVVGYMGHNFFYDFDDFSFPELTDLARPLARPKGLFAIGCKTGEVPGFTRLIRTNVHVVLFTHDFMAVEGHATLALADGLVRMMPGKRIARLANRAYAHFQKLYKPDSRPGTHYWSHDFGLFD